MGNIKKIKVGDTTYDIAVNLNDYYDKTEVDTALASKVDVSALDDIQEVIAASLNELENDKADASTTYTKTEVNTALSTKQDTLVSGTNIKTINNTSLLGSGNIDIQGGGGKAVSGGTNISITTGETADTINCTLPIIEGSNSSGKGIIVGDSECSASGIYAIALGHNSDVGGAYSFCDGSNSQANGQMAFAFGDGCKANYNQSVMFGIQNVSTKPRQYSFGTNVKPQNELEFGFGKYNNSSSASTTFGHSGNTLFSVGNGYDFSSTHNWHNAFEVRQNGDIYVPNTDDSSVTGDYAYSLYPMVRLQDTITATAANTTALGGLSLVKLTQAEYDALATKDSNTLYVIVG